MTPFPFRPSIVGRRGKVADIFIQGMKLSFSIRYKLEYHWVLLLPSLAVLFFVFIYPISLILARSFLDPSLTFEHYIKFFETAVYFKVLLITFKISFMVTAVALILGYPVAFFLCRAPDKSRNYYMIMVLIPFWTSLLVRNYAWMVFLGREGVMNRILLLIGVIDAPLKLLHTTFAVIVGMVHMMLPFMILSLLSVMKGIDMRLLRAASSLGANLFQSFVKVYFPLSLPGVAAGSLLVFIFSLGFFITPALLGGREDMMISMLIEVQVSDLLNWGFASTLSVILLVMTLILFYVYNRFLGLDRIWGTS
jgi:putative spermidine/putrescine transport system permease protein